jgi:hypothetical protein
VTMTGRGDTLPASHNAYRTQCVTRLMLPPLGPMLPCSCRDPVEGASRPSPAADRQDQPVRHRHVLRAWTADPAIDQHQTAQDPRPVGAAADLVRRRKRTAQTSGPDVIGGLRRSAPTRTTAGVQHDAHPHGDGDPDRDGHTHRHGHRDGDGHADRHGQTHRDRPSTSTPARPFACSYGQPFGQRYECRPQPARTPHHQPSDQNT